MIMGVGTGAVVVMILVEGISKDDRRSDWLTSEGIMVLFAFFSCFLPLCFHVVMMYVHGFLLDAQKRYPCSSMFLCYGNDLNGWES